MSSRSSSSYFKKIYIQQGLEGSPYIESALGFFDGYPISFINDKKEIPPEDAHSTTVYVDLPKASIVSSCPGSKGHVCCNYKTINLYTGCVLGCSYCVMKTYLNYEPVVVNIAIDNTIDEVIELANKNPLRIGTGEVGDSLDLDPIFNLSRHFVRAFADIPNITFELKTKTSSVDHLLGIEGKGNAVIGFSLNPESIIASEEGTSASLRERIDAAELAIKTGYRVSFHFDPIFRFPNWEEEYAKTIEALSNVKSERVAWISMGTFRYPKGLKEKIDERWYLYDELVQCRDKKFRYVQSVRRTMYEAILSKLRLSLPGVPVYMCMESPHIWERVFGNLPHEIKNLQNIFDAPEPEAIA
jgi:spore photoproduct lyase